MEPKKFAGRPKPSGSLSNSSQVLNSAEDIMRKSGGLSSMRKSGASFRPSSRDGRPGSSQSSSYSLSFSPNFDELSLASSIKMDLIQLQDEIDNLDMDGKLRSGKMEFMSAHITQMRKWLSLNSKISKRHVEKAINNDINTDKLLQTLKVPNSEEGMKKMFKIANLMDILLNKMTEYEIIYLLRYDEIYSNLTKNQPSIQSLNNKQNMIAQGIDTKKFLPSLANIERLVQMYQLCAKQNQDQMNKTGGFSSIGLNSGPQLDATGIQSIEDMVKYLKKLPQKVMPDDFKKLLVSQLEENQVLQEKFRVQNAFMEAQNQMNKSGQNFNKGPNLEKQVQQLQSQMREVEEDKNSIFQRMQQQISIIENLKSQLAEKEGKLTHLQQTLEMAQQNQSQPAQQQQQEKQSSSQTMIGQKPPLHKDDPEYWTRLIDETKQIYDQRQREILEENDNLKEKIIQKNVKIEQQMTQLTESFQKEQDFREWKQDYFREFKKNFQNKEEYQSAYEKALLMEFDRYKKAWERKIDDLSFELENIKKQNARQTLDIKNKLKKEEETKQLLLKKLSCYLQ